MLSEFTESTLRSLRDTIPGRRVSIIGSGPSASLYKPDGTFSIAVNGAARLGWWFDIFLYGDSSSPQRDWFGIDCATRRVVARAVAQADDIVFPNLDERTIVQTHLQSTIKLPQPRAPHVVFDYQWFKPRTLHSKPDYLMFCGTISCCAAQLAYIMGATSLVFYGCEFSHSEGHYFYESTHNGRIEESQLATMLIVLDELRDLGVEIEICGDSWLKCPKARL